MKKSSFCGAAALLLLAGCGAVGVQGQSASTWSKRGVDAETREDFDVAFEAFRQAHLKKPGDLRYKERYERLRFQAVHQHVDRGRVLRQSGDVGGAINEFARALQIDPGNQAAAQELQLTEQPSGNTGSNGAAGASAAPTAPGNPGTAAGPARAEDGQPGHVLVPGLEERTPHQQSAQRDLDSIAAPVTLQAVSNDPITLHMVEDTKVIYQAIGKAAGLNVIFDPEYTSKRVPVDLTSVSLPDALRIVGVLSGTFWKPVTPNTIFVAQNNRTKRTDFEDLAVQTFYLTNVSQQNDANEILVALRNLLDSSIKVYLVASQNAIVLRATPDQLVLAEKLINDLDRTRAEVVVDVAVLEVNRDKIRNLGITLPTSFGLTPTTTTTASSTTTGSPATNSNGTASTPVTSQNLTLNSLGNLNATNFAVTVSGGTVNALLSDSDTRILQNPRLRATDGQRATLKIGSKIPVAQGSYSSTLSATASLGIQTQFTYLDVGVNIDITPTVHYNRDISMKMKIEVSTHSSDVVISNVTEPVISQRISEQTIQLKEGEPSLLAGILQQQESRSTNGTPGLGELPILKYFFSTQGKEVQKDEIIFLLIPHIVRESILSDENTRAIYTGTSSSVELIRREAPKPNMPAATVPVRTGTRTSAANAAASMLPQLAADAQPLPNSGATADGSSTVPQAGTVPVSLTVVAPAGPQAVGSTFQVVVNAANAHDLFSVPLQMHFDPRVLSLVNVDAGDFLGHDGQAVALVHRDEGNGTVTISASRPPNTQGRDGAGPLCTLTFKALAAGDAPLQLVRVGAKDSHQNNLPAVGNQGVVHVQ